MIKIRTVKAPIIIPIVNPEFKFMNCFKGVAAMWQTGVNLTYENN